MRYNSQTNLKERVNSVDLEFEISDMNNQSDQLLLKIDVTDFVKTLDRVDAILWEVWYDKGITTKRDLADHFNIDPSSALIYINELKEKFRNYVEDKERI